MNVPPNLSVNLLDVAANLDLRLWVCDIHGFRPARNNDHASITAGDCAKGNARRIDRGDAEGVGYVQSIC